VNPALVVALVAAAAFLPSFAGVFHFDDYNVIVHYDTVHSWQALAERWGGGVRPLLKASYTLNWTLGQGEFGFHLFNITVHALNAVLLFFIGSILFRNAQASFVAALLFALHPAATEAVTYISGRSSSLMASFYLGALLVYLRGGHWAISSFLFLCAAAVRETAVTLPAALVLAEAARGWPGWREILRRQWAHWALLAAGAVFVLLSDRYFHHLAFGYTLRGLGENLLTQVGGISYLVSRLVALHGYNIDPDLPTLVAWDGVLAFQAILLFSLLILGITQLRARPWIAFGILWFFLQLAPTNSIVPRVDVANDRQLYLAGWGLFLALAVQLNLDAIKAVPLIALFAIACVSRQLDYASEIRLWESSVRLAPGNSRAHNNLGYAYQLEGRTAEARREYDTALFLDPANRKARYNRMLLP
jgi:tetratricopeptide (TPR) repeat protein